ncbi:hypothetical protein [Streptomyces violascens]|uniref:hypothetical protein n=1 Tax=Streptomyces violascens TaxID=67381 RepID=UPI0016722C42|nr:hypothetical protein [Streptomyces violascens]
MTETTVEKPVSELSAYLQDLVRSDPARVLPAVNEVVVALHAVALDSVSVAPSPDLFDVGRNLARIDDAGIEIVTAVRALLGPAVQVQADAELSRMEALIATMPAPRTQPGWRQSSTGLLALP